MPETLKRTTGEGVVLEVDLADCLTQEALRAIRSLSYAKSPRQTIP
jgi:hypothetical protein